MSKIFSLIFALACFTPAFSQNDQSSQKIFRKYSDYKGAISYSLNKTMLDALDVDLDYKDHMKNISGDIHRLSFIVFDDNSPGSKIINTLVRDIKKEGFINVPIEIEESDLQVLKIYGIKKNGFYSNVFILVLDDDDQAYFLAVNGKLKIKTKA